jgi:hypothetical protein
MGYEDELCLTDEAYQHSMASGWLYVPSTNVTITGFSEPPGEDRTTDSSDDDDSDSSSTQSSTLDDANNSTTTTPQQQPWPYKDPSSCSVYGSGNLLNFVCKNAGTTPYANSARGCLQSYWDPGTGTYSMTQGGPGVPWKPIDPGQSVVSFVNSHAVCLVGALFY